MLFRENLNRICKEKGTTLTAMIKSLGISTKLHKSEHLVFRKTLFRICVICK